ncbi:hypothetical protein IZ6_23170 [Terrihabitans soli]|uniref:SH3b domain-containing protein n=1 Tax=Terrihabitans soli TaxID=708113 RepID=A0A6S6QWF9_9HYPH|nr:SH3 domain-containing protein [Terrihabitans soli]BCJ91582.1 hypothetical protein IZ6_23170 [Terrihabitans soli]
MVSRKTTISAAALLLASAGAAAAFPATATTDLNVRSGPGTGYSVVDRLEAGDTVEIVATRGSWYQTAEGGWASGNYFDAAGGPATYYGDSYGSDDYGPVAFYYGEDPYYWDNAGYYFYLDGGRRHRVGWDWFRDHDHNRFRWGNANYRRDFENRRGQWDGQRNARGEWDGQRRGGGDSQNWDGRRGDGQARMDGQPRGDGQQNFRRNDGGVSAGASVSDRGLQVEGERTMRSGRASAERIEGGGGRGGRGGDFEGGRRGGDGGQGGGVPWRPNQGGGN